MGAYRYGYSPTSMLMNREPAVPGRSHVPMVRPFDTRVEQSASPTWDEDEGPSVSAPVPVPREPSMLERAIRGGLIPAEYSLPDHYDYEQISRSPASFDVGAMDHERESKGRAGIAMAAVGILWFVAAHYSNKAKEDEEKKRK